MNKKNKIGFGGGCHWCTEAVFQHLQGVSNVEQGWIASNQDNHAFSEAVVVTFDYHEIPLQKLVEIHLHTHKSAVNHSMRKKYRSAVYYFDENQKIEVEAILDTLQFEFEGKLVTKALPFLTFKPSEEAFVNYYSKNPQKPFCEKFIDPKLQLLLKKFERYAKTDKIEHNETI